MIPHRSNSSLGIIRIAFAFSCFGEYDDAKFLARLSPATPEPMITMSDCIAMKYKRFVRVRLLNSKYRKRVI